MNILQNYIINLVPRVSHLTAPWSAPGGDKGAFALHRTADLCTWPWLSKRFLPEECRVAWVAGIKSGRGRGNLGFPFNACHAGYVQRNFRFIYFLIFFFRLLCVHNCPLNPIWKVILSIMRGFLVLTAKVLIQFIINALRVHSSPMLSTFSATSTNLWLVKKIFTQRIIYKKYPGNFSLENEMCTLHF